MKITFLVSGSIRSNFSYRALALARSLRAQGHDVSIIAPKADKYTDFIPETITDIDGVRILQPFQFATRQLVVNLIPYLFGSAYLLLRERPELVYIYKPTPISVVGLAAKVLFKTETVADFDDLGAEVMRIEGHPAYQRRLVAWSERLAARHADRLIVASTYLQDLYTKEYPNKSILLLPNGVEDDWFAATTPAAPKQIVFLGAINRTNILEPLFAVLPEVLAAHPTTEILIIGDGKYLTHFKEVAQKLGIAAHVTFTGWLALADARAHLAEGAIGYNYMPDEATTNAASNMKLPQYMSRGVVPLVSDVGDLVRTVDGGKAGYIARAGDTASLSQTLIVALGDTHRSEKASRAISFAKEHLSWEKLSEQFTAWMRPPLPEEAKIYFVSTSVPGNVGGPELRNYNVLKQMIAKVTSNVEAFCISSNPNEIRGKDLEDVTMHVVPNYASSALERAYAIVVKQIAPSMYDFARSSLGATFRAACEKSLPSIVHVEQLQGYYAIREHIPWLKSRGVRIVFDCHNVEFKAIHDALEISSRPRQLIGEYLTRHLAALEIEATRAADLVLACSEKDAAFFREYSANVLVVPNGVNCSDFPTTPHDDTPTLIFIGGTGYPPNADALEFYLTRVHPEVKYAIPDVALLAIGCSPEWLAGKGINDSSVQPLGFVDDTRPYLQRAAIGICPVRRGSGTRIKILTYMGAGLPVVSTAKGAEGVGYTDGQDIVIADEANEFAAAIIKLWANRTYRDTIARSGHDFTCRTLDWNVIGDGLAAGYIA